MAARTLGLGASLFLVANAADYFGPAAKCNTPCVSFTLTLAANNPLPKTACSATLWQVCLIHKTSLQDPKCPAAGSDPNWPSYDVCYTVKAGTTVRYNMPAPAGTQCQANTLAYKTPSAESASCQGTMSCCPITTGGVASCEGIMRQFGDKCMWELTTPPAGCGCENWTPPATAQVLPSETCSTKCMDLTVTPKAGTDTVKGCGITSWEICRKYKYSDTVAGCPDKTNLAWPSLECFTAEPGLTKSFAFYAPNGKCSGSVPGKFIPTLAQPDGGKCNAHAKCCSVDKSNAALGCSGIVQQAGDFCEWDVALPSADCGCANAVPGANANWPTASCQSPCVDIRVTRIEGEVCPKFWNVCMQYKYGDEVAGCPDRTDPNFQPATKCWSAPTGQKFPVEFHSRNGGCSKNPLAAVGGLTVKYSSGSRICPFKTSCCAASAGKPTCADNTQPVGEWCRWEVDVPDAACTCTTESTSATTASTSKGSTTKALTSTTKPGGGGQESLPANMKKASADPFASVSNAEVAATSWLSAAPSSSWAAFFAVSLAAGGAVAAAWRRGGRGAQAQVDENGHWLAAESSGEE